MCPIMPELILFLSVAWSNQEYFYSPLDGMLVYCRVTPVCVLINKYTWVDRGTARVKCHARTQHNVPGQDSNQDRSIRSQEY